MDDYNIHSLTESRNEWTARLVTIMCPFIIEGFKSIYKDAYKLCIENDEENKYLMTFQNLLSRIPKWNKELIENEVTRIKENSKCGYIEDLITCVHIIQLKALTCIRVGQNQKKVDIDIPNLADFIHKIYILVARKLYTNIYLFQNNINPLEIQKHNREIELIIKECILNAIRDTIPIETILRSYLDEVTEETVEVEEEFIPAEDTSEVGSDVGSEVGSDGESTIDDEKPKSSGNNNILIEEVMNDAGTDTIKIKDNDNLVISDDNYGIMLDIKNLNENEESNTQDLGVKPNMETSRKEEILEPDTSIPSIINPIVNEDKPEVNFSNKVDVTEIEGLDDLDDDKIKIEESDLKLDDIISLENIDTGPSLLGDIETLS